MSIVASIEGEYRRYKALADAAIQQLSTDQLARVDSRNGNSVATIAWHVAGNLASRFTNFLDEDGEKAWRDREDEFAQRQATHEELLDHWERGWQALFGTLESLADDQLTRTVRIRGQELLVHEALHRSLAHTSYHVGQIVFLAKALRGEDWEYLSIPPGGSAAYNANPTSDKPRSHASRLKND